MIPDDFHLTPFIPRRAEGNWETLLADYARRGFSTASASGCRASWRGRQAQQSGFEFFSGIIREPLAGLEAALPVPETVVHTHASPRAAIGFRRTQPGLRAMRSERASISPCRACAALLPNRSQRCSASPASAWGANSPEHDPLVARIVDGWPQRIEARRARELGFKAESSSTDRAHPHRRGQGGTFID